MRSEAEVERLIEEMVSRTKGTYITQGCSFNKNCPRQMNLLKKALMHSNSFSGLVKEVLAVNFGGGAEVHTTSSPLIADNIPSKRSVDGWL